MAELKKYYADNHNALLLENIMQFAANITLKDKNAEDVAETDQSRFFRDILKKYYEDRLNFSDIIALKKFVDNYNSEATKTVENIFSEKTTEDLLKDIFRVSVQTIDGSEYLYDLSTDKKNLFLVNTQTYFNSLKKTTLYPYIDSLKKAIAAEQEEPELYADQQEDEQSIKEFENEKDYSKEFIKIVEKTISIEDNLLKVNELRNSILNNIISYPELDAYPELKKDENIKNI